MTIEPEFLIIGAARAGTTSLHSFLRQHPGVFLPRGKEPNYFAYAGRQLDCRGPGADFINNSCTDASAYAALFSAAPAGALRGEASPLYLFESAAPVNIRQMAPRTKLIAILRNPVDQAWSHFLYATKLRVETEPDFVKALSIEEERLAQGWQPLFGYSSFPRYGEQLARYLDLFPRDQILIRTYEDLQTRPAELLRDIFGFIGADADFPVDTSQVLNPGGIPKNARFQDFLMKPNPITGAIGYIIPRETRWKIRDWLAGFNMTLGNKMPEQARRILLERLSDDIRLTERLTALDLSHWLK